jgi:RND superfamily putative drug exporter
VIAVIKLKNWRNLSFVFWVIVTIFILITMPNLDQLVKEKGQITIPKTEQSYIASEVVKRMDKEAGENYDIIVVFSSGSKAALTSKQKAEIASVIQSLKAQQKQLGIDEIVSHFDRKELEKQLVSKDNTTILTQIAVDKDHGDITKVAKELNDTIKVDHVQVYLTGSDLISDDFIKSTQAGVKKTEIIAIIFIVVVLILVFRSPIVPIISLLTVGVSYLVSLGVVAHLVNTFNYPFSNFTQVFLVVVLFGVGTDYNILLFTRFKEELSKHRSVHSAVTAAFQSAGKTILYSGVAVFIGFASLLMANFKLYQATSGVAIGIAVLLLVLTTLNPFFMVVLGKKMFYPIKKFDGHEDSKLWGFLAANSVTRPIMSFVLVFALAVSSVLSYSWGLNYNDLWEVDDQYNSKQGIKVIEEHFPAGFSSPATLVIQSKKKLDEASYLQILDELADKITKINGVAEVYSPTRPTGEKIEALYISKQANELDQGLDSSNKGIGQINEGLTSVTDQMGNSDSNNLSNVQKLIDGTKSAKDGVSKLEDAIHTLAIGMKSGAAGANQIEAGLASVTQNIDTLSGATSQLYAGYSQLENGLSSYHQYFQRISQAIEGAINGYQQIEESMNNLIEAKPELASDPNIQRTLSIAKSAQAQFHQLGDQMKQLATKRESAMASFRKANQSLANVNDGLKQMKRGVAQLQQGATKLKTGLNQGASGSSQIVSKTDELQAGLSEINQGQVQLLHGLKNLQANMKQLQSGLSSSSSGLKKVSNGLKDAQKYLADLSASTSSEQFYVPQKVLESADFQKSLNAYMSNDRKIAKMTIILDVNPYSEEAMPIIQKINQQVDAGLSGTDLKDATVAIGGTTAKNVDLKHVTQSDFFRTAIIMLIEIALILLVITRSVTSAISIIVSLIFVYFTSLGIGEWMTSQFLHVEIMSWNVPFFSFIMIVALGVDYSIFWIMRYNESDGEQTTRIIDASRHIGGVVLSAAIILGGTFAALIPSRVPTLIQVSFVVIVGLLLLSLIGIPVLLPAFMGIKRKLDRFLMK